MTSGVGEPNRELALVLLTAGHDEQMLVKHAGFLTLPDARAFAARPDVRADVERAAEMLARRVGRKGLTAVEKLLDSGSTDGRTRVAAARAAMEAGGILRKDARDLETKQLRELSVAELAQMIEQTRSELQRAEAAAASRQPRLTSST